MQGFFSLGYSEMNCGFKCLECSYVHLKEKQIKESFSETINLLKKKKKKKG